MNVLQEIEARPELAPLLKATNEQLREFIKKHFRFYSLYPSLNQYMREHWVDERQHRGELLGILLDIQDGLNAFTESKQELITSINALE